MVFLRLSWIVQDLYGGLYIFLGLHGARMFFVTLKMELPPLFETFARFQVGLLASEGFHGISWIFKDFRGFRGVRFFP